MCSLQTLFLLLVFGVDNVHPDMLLRGPYFVSQPMDATFQVSVDGGEQAKDANSVAFDCEARGVPQPTYTWYQDKASGVSNRLAQIRNHKIRLFYLLVRRII